MKELSVASGPRSTHGLLAALAAFAFGIAACSSSSSENDNAASTKHVPLDAEAFCARADECGSSVSKDECVGAFSALRVSQSCRDAVEAASCEELMASSSQVKDTCFPPCSGVASCEGKILTKCDDGRRYVADCDEICKLAGKESAVECSSSSDEPKCVCN